MFNRRPFPFLGIKADDERRMWERIFRKPKPEKVETKRKETKVVSVTTNYEEAFGSSGRGGSQPLRMVTSLPSPVVDEGYYIVGNVAELYVSDGTNWYLVGAADAVSSLPTQPTKGKLVYKTDEKKLYCWDGNQWLSETDKAGLGTAFPSAPVTGMLFFRTDQQKLYLWNGTQWVETGGGGGVQFGTSFPSNPQTGALFYRTDQRRLYAYNGTVWVAQESIQTATPSSPVSGEVWLEESNFRVGVRGTNTSYIGFVRTNVPTTVEVVSSGGDLFSGAAPLNHKHRLNTGVVAGTNTLNTNAPIALDTDSSAFLINRYTGTAYLGEFRQISGAYVPQLDVTGKVVSANNNDIVVAKHPYFALPCLNFQVLSTETTRSEFYVDLGIAALFAVGTPVLNNLRFEWDMHIVGQPNFTYQWQLTFFVYDFTASSSYAVIVTSISFSTDTNSSGHAHSNSSATVSLGSTSRRFVCVVRIMRRRGAEMTGTRPDNCYLLPFFKISCY
jgi:hypothetical protein